MALDTAQKLANFNLCNQDGVAKTNASHSGKWLVLYVYPKDDTLGTVVVGISADDSASHKAFCNKFNFTIELLAAPRAELLAKLGFGQSEWQGVDYWNRSTVIVDPAGVVRKVYQNVNATGHEQAVLGDLRSLQSAK